MGFVVRACALAALVCALIVALPRPAIASTRITVTPDDVNDVLLNPGKGLWLLGGDGVDWSYQVFLDENNEPLDATEAAKAEAAVTNAWFVGRDTTKAGQPRCKWPDYTSRLGIGYFRFAWSVIEPEPGVYNWEPLEKKIEAYTKQGKQYAFGIAAANSLSDDQYTTPKWVFDMGAESVTFYEPNSSGVYRNKTYPVWTDPIYLQRLHQMERAVAERYKNDPRILFVDTRGYGNYGEQHLYGINQATDNLKDGYARTKAISSDQLRDLYLKPFLEAFEGGTVQVCTVCGEKDYRNAYLWAVDNGYWVRRDGILGGDGLDSDGNFKFWTDGSECAISEDKAPAVFELALGGSYTALKARCPEQWDTAHLTLSIETGKASFLLIYPDLYRDNAAYCDWAANKVGYWFRLKRASYNSQMVVGKPSSVEITFKNDGVAPIFMSNASCLALLKSDGTVAARSATSWDAFSWKPNAEKTETANVTFSGVSPGTYRLAYGLLKSQSDASPTYLLGSAGKTGDKWYVLGEVELLEPTAHVHAWDTPSYTWAADGSACTATHTCSDCQEAESQTVVPARTALTEATCEEPGKVLLSASFENGDFATQAKTMETPALGHRWDNGVVTVQPTHMREGTRVYTCLRNPLHTKTEVIPALGEGPETPASPTAADDPKTSDEPAEPADSATPASPASPASPATPAEPGTSANPESPGSPAAPDGPSSGWICTGGAWHWRLGSGLLATGWVWDGTGWYYFDKSCMMVTGWLWDGGDWYYLSELHDGSFGAMVTGWLWDNGWYWLNLDSKLQSYGSMMRNAWVSDRGAWYLAGPGGIIVRGWQWFEGSWWYLNEWDGRLLTNALTPDGQQVDALGRWVGR